MASNAAGLLAIFTMTGIRGPPAADPSLCAGRAFVHGLFYHRGRSRGALSDVREPTLTIVCEPCGRRGRYAVARLIEKYGADAKLPDLRLALANCEKTK